MKNVNIKWQDYKEMVGDVVKRNKSYYYRGQIDCKWILQTSFHRIIERKKISMSLIDYLDRVLPVLGYHISAIRNEIINLDNPTEFGAFLALLRHHRFPTPLLDWTLSPYIAAYFALRDIDDSNPRYDCVKIHVFDFTEWRTSYDQPLNLRAPGNFVSIFTPYAKFNPRLISQQCAYTVTNVSNMTSYILQCEKKAKKDFLHSYELSVKERTQIMRELNLMGINDMTLFPGVDGICNTAQEWFFSKDKVGPTPMEKEEIPKLLADLVAQSKSSSSSSLSSSRSSKSSLFEDPISEGTSNK